MLERTGSAMVGDFGELEFLAEQKEIGQKFTVSMFLLMENFCHWPISIMFSPIKTANGTAV